MLLVELAEGMCGRAHRGLGPLMFIMYVAYHYRKLRTRQIHGAQHVVGEGSRSYLVSVLSVLVWAC